MRVAVLQPVTINFWPGERGYAASLYAGARALDILEKISWIGAVGDMPAVYSAIDVAIKWSLSEGFPNAGDEAMACETPCVTTDWNDCRWIVGDNGEFVAVDTLQALVDAWSALSARLGQAGRLPDYRACPQIEYSFCHQKLIKIPESILHRLRDKTTADAGRQKA